MEEHLNNDTIHCVGVYNGYLSVYESLYKCNYLNIIIIVCHLILLTDEKS